GGQWIRRGMGSISWASASGNSAGRGSSPLGMPSVSCPPLVQPRHLAYGVGSSLRLSYFLLRVLHTVPGGRGGGRRIARQRRRRAPKLLLRAHWGLTHEQEVTPLMSGIADVCVFRSLRGVENHWPSDHVKELLAI